MVMTASRALRILVIEDHLDTLQLMGHLLERHGYAPVLADSCATARVAMENQTPDLVITDIGLPDGSALDLVQWLKSRHNIPIIATTGYGLPSEIDALLAAGIDHCLIKPIGVEALIAGVLAMLAGPPPAHSTDGDSAG